MDPRHRLQWWQTRGHVRAPYLGSSRAKLDGEQSPQGSPSCDESETDEPGASAAAAGERDQAEAPVAEAGVRPARSSRKRRRLERRAGLSDDLHERVLRLARACEVVLPEAPPPAAPSAGAKRKAPAEGAVAGSATAPVAGAPRGARDTHRCVELQV